MATAEASDVVFRHVDRHDLERRSRPESSHKGNLKRLKTSSVGGFQRWEKENELLWAMLEDETEWLAKLFPDIIITPELFFFALEDGVVLCRLANLIQETADKHARKNKVKVPAKSFKFHTSIPKKNKQLALFKSRENVSGFLAWCRQIGISDSILFESNDVVEADECREGCREVVICLMEIARRASGSFKFTPIPKLIQLEKEIEIEEQKDAEENSFDQVDYASSDEESNNSCPSPEALSPPTNDQGSHTSPGGSKKKSKRQQPKSELDKEVLKIIDNFNFYNIRKIKEGKYMILGKIIFVRMLNGHVLLRIGGGWDTLEHYLLTHLPKAAPENGDCTTEAAVSPSVSKTPQKSQLTKILDKVKKEQQLKKATPVSSPFRTAGSKGSKPDDSSGDDEKDITSAIRKIEFSVNQNIATRRKLSRQSNEDTPQKSPNSLEQRSPDINQNNIETQKVRKSKSPDKAKGKTMENEVTGNECNGEVELNSEQENGNELLSFESGLVKENNNDNTPSEERTATPENVDVVDGAVLAKLSVESTTGAISAEPEERQQVEYEPNAHVVKDDNEQSSETEVCVERSEETPAEEAPADVISEIPVVAPNECDLPKDTSDVSVKDAEVPPCDPEVSPSDPEVQPSDAKVPPTETVVPSNPDVSPVVTEDAKDSETSDAISEASVTPNVPQSPQKSPSPNGDESSKEKTSKTAKEPTKTKPVGTKAPAKKNPTSSAGARPKSAKPSTRPATAVSSAVKNIKRPASATRTSTTAPKPGTTGAAKPNATAAKTKTSTTKPSTVASKTKVPPSGKSTITKPPGGKTSPTHSMVSKKPTPRPDPKGTTSTRTAKPHPKPTPTTQPSRPIKNTAFGSTVSTGPSKKPAQSERPVTAPPARSTNTQTKKKPPVHVAAKVNSWSSTSRPQSAKPSSKSAKDSTDGVATSKETGKKPSGDRPLSPTKPLVRKTQTRTVTTTKTTRVGADGEPEVKSQTLKTTRTVTEANGKKTTKTTVKEVSPPGRKPLRMTTETIEGGSGKKKTTKTVADSKTGAKATKPDAKKPSTKTGPSKPSKETGSKKAPTKTVPESKEVSGQLKEVPKAKTVKELSNALGITKAASEKEKETESKDVKEPVKKEVEAPSPEETPEQPPAPVEESPQVEESVQVEEAPIEVSPEAAEVVQSQENRETENQDGESGIVNTESGVEEVSQGHGGTLVDTEVGKTEGQGVEEVNNEVTESIGDKGVEIDDALVNGDAEQSEVIVNGVNLVEDSENINVEEKMAEQVEVQENKNVAGDEIATNEEESGKIVLEDGDAITTFAQKVITEAHEEIIVEDSPELREPSERVGFDESLEDDSLDVIEVPESDVSLEENVLESSEAWPAVSVDKEPAREIDLLGDNNNAIEESQETESKFDPYLLPSGTDTEKLVDTSADQNTFDVSVEGKAESWLSEDLGSTGEPPNRDSGFQETNTVDDLLG